MTFKSRSNHGTSPQHLQNADKEASVARVRHAGDSFNLFSAVHRQLNHGFSFVCKPNKQEYNVHDMLHIGKQAFDGHIKFTFRQTKNFIINKVFAITPYRVFLRSEL